MSEETAIDCRGLACPQPVIKTREQLERSDREFTVLVDNEAARDNVSRYARDEGCRVEVAPSEDGFMVCVYPQEKSARRVEDESSVVKAATANKVIFITTDEVGRGDRELGVKLMNAFLFACTENEDRPAKIVFMNSGVRLVTENQETIEHIRKLEEAGTEILACGTCLDFYGLKERLGVGRLSNMYEIQSILIGADRLVSV